MAINLYSFNLVILFCLQSVSCLASYFEEILLSYLRSAMSLLIPQLYILPSVPKNQDSTRRTLTFYRGN